MAVVKSMVKALGRLEEGVLAVSLLLLAFMGFVEVVSRTFFNHSFTWFEELARYSGVFITFLGASLGIKYGTHFSMDFFLTRVSARTGGLMRAASALIAGALFVWIGWIAYAHLAKVYRFGTTSAAMGLPMYLAYLPVALFSFTLGCRSLLAAWRHLRAALDPAEDDGSAAGEAAS